MKEKIEKTKGRYELFRHRSGRTRSSLCNQQNISIKSNVRRFCPIKYFKYYSSKEWQVSLFKFPTLLQLLVPDPLAFIRRPESKTCASPDAWDQVLSAVAASPATLVNRCSIIFFFFFYEKSRGQNGGKEIRRAIVALKWSYFYWPLPLAGAATEVFFFFRPANTPRDADVTNCWTEGRQTAVWFSPLETRPNLDVGSLVFKVPSSRQTPTKCVPLH